MQFFCKHHIFTFIRFCLFINGRRSLHLSVIAWAASILSRKEFWKVNGIFIAAGFSDLRDRIICLFKKSYSLNTPYIRQEFCRRHSLVFLKDMVHIIRWDPHLLCQLTHHDLFTVILAEIIFQEFHTQVSLSSSFPKPFFLLFLFIFIRILWICTRQPSQQIK